MKQLLLAMTLFGLLAFPGCGRIDPLSPRLENEISNQNGKIDDIQNNQNGVLLEFGKLKNDQNIMAEKINNMQQGLVNKNNENTGVQIFQGDGGLIAAFAIAVFLILIIYHYKTRADRKQKIAEILAQEITLYNDLALENEVFAAAMNTDVEEDIYKLIVKHQKLHQG